MNTDDVSEVVKIHMGSFADFFLTSLGKRFLSLYFEGILREQRAIALVEEDDILRGYIVGIMHPRAFYSRLLARDWYRFLRASLSAILRRPSIVLRLARALKKADAAPGGKDDVELTSIAVRTDAQRSSIGRLLLAAFLDECRSVFAKRVVLTTDADGNERVNSFYRSAGFVVSRTFTTPEGRRMNEYLYDLSKQQHRAEHGEKRTHDS